MIVSSHQRLIPHLFHFREEREEHDTRKGEGVHPENRRVGASTEEEETGSYTITNSFGN